MRFLQRSVRQTVVDYVKGELAELGWVEEPINFGADPVVFIEVDRQERVDRIDPTTLSVWIPGESQDRLTELGGVLYQTNIDIVLDIYAEKAAYAIALGSDLKDLFRDRAIPLIDHGAATPPSTPVQAGTIEFRGAWLDRPSAPVNALEFRGKMRTVRLYCLVTFED